MHPADKFNEKLYNALGKLTVDYSRIEHLMQVFANFLINPSQATIGMIVTSDMPFLALHKVLMS